jgi:hypothetical protein
MEGELEAVLRGLDTAVERAHRYRFELTQEYLALVARIEALPENQPGADKSHVSRDLRAYTETFKSVRPAPQGP